MIKLKDRILSASLALEDIWKMRAEVQPLSESGLVVAQCKVLQLQLQALILANKWEEP